MFYKADKDVLCNLIARLIAMLSKKLGLSISFPFFSPRVFCFRNQLRKVNLKKSMSVSI